MTEQIGCFGSVLYQDAQSKRCSSCSLLADCTAQVEVNREHLRQWREEIQKDAKASPAAKRLVRKAAKAEVGTSVETPATPVSGDATMERIRRNCEALTVKYPREHTVKWLNKGVDIHAYKRGVNGFINCGNRYAAVAMQYFMDRHADGNPGVTHMELLEHLMKALNWQGGSANSHATIVFKAFETLEIIHFVEGKAYLR